MRRPRDAEPPKHTVKKSDYILLINFPIFLRKHFFIPRLLFRFADKFLGIMKSIEKTLYNMSKAHQRESAKSQGFYDGRFRTRKIELKKHKKARHKNSIFNYE